MTKSLSACKICFGLCVFLMLQTVSAKAQEVGGYGFLKIPVSARAAALGGTLVSVVEPEASLADQNPALLCPEMNKEVSLSYINYISDVNIGYASFTGNFLSHGAWQGAVRYVDYGSFAGYDQEGTYTGDFSAKDIAISGSVGYPINDRFNVGGTIRGIITNYESYNAFALGVDIGINYYNENVGRSLSLVATNLGGQIKRLDERYTKLPTQIALGWTEEFEHIPICLTLTAHDLLDWDLKFIQHFNIGVEWIVNEYLYFGGGYNFRNFSVGGGFKYRSWNFQCSYARYNSLEGSLHIGLSYKFNKKKK